jgi:glucan biosynthesis protein C
MPPITERRHEVDALRAIAVLLLIAYHAGICFQPWASLIGFPQAPRPLDAIAGPMQLLSVFRIPLLFFVAGVGVRFAARSRGPGALLVERARRILLPFVFGVFAVAPLHVLALQWMGGSPIAYEPGPAHLWFLGNLFVYVLAFLPLVAWARRAADQPWLARLRAAVERRPWLLLVGAVPHAAESLLLGDGEHYAMFALTWHGFALGAVLFAQGFLLALLDDAFWRAMRALRWPCLCAAVALGCHRLGAGGAPHWREGIESAMWLHAAIGFGSLHLDRPSATMRYLAAAVLPVYMLHMAPLFLACAIVLPLPWSPWLQLIAVVVVTLAASFGAYELALRRVRWLQPLFGMAPAPRGE